MNTVQNDEGHKTDTQCTVSCASEEVCHRGSAQVAEADAVNGSSPDQQAPNLLAWMSLAAEDHGSKTWCPAEAEAKNWPMYLMMKAPQHCWLPFGDAEQPNQPASVDAGVV